MFIFRCVEMTTMSFIYFLCNTSVISRCNTVFYFISYSMLFYLILFYGIVFLIFAACNFVLSPFCHDQTNKGLSYLILYVTLIILFKKRFILFSCLVFSHNGFPPDYFTVGSGRTVERNSSVISRCGFPS